MKNRSRLNAQQAQQEQQQASQETRPSPLEFGSVDDLLRHDALHTPVPPGIAERLQKTLGPGRTSGSSWWRRFFQS